MESEHPGPEPEPNLTRPPQRRRGIVGPVVLILLGIIFLLSNLGLVSWNVWEMMWRLWPIWLVAAGLDMLLGRRSGLGGWIVLAVTLAIVGGAGWFVQSWQTGGGVGPAESFQYPVEQAKKADVTIQPGVARLQVRAGQPGVLAAGSVQSYSRERVLRDCACSGEEARFTLQTEEWEQVPFLGNHGPGPMWDLELSPAIPMELRVSTGVGTSDLDLSDLKVTALEVNTGVGQTEITLPRQGTLTADIDSGVGELVVRIPAGMAARIAVDSGVGHVGVSGSFTKQGDLYVSPGYDTAESRVDMTIDGGVGAIRVEEIGQ